MQSKYKTNGTQIDIPTFIRSLLSVNCILQIMSIGVLIYNGRQIELSPTYDNLLHYASIIFVTMPHLCYFWIHSAAVFTFAKVYYTVRKTQQQLNKIQRRLAIANLVLTAVLVALILGMLTVTDQCVLNDVAIGGGLLLGVIGLLVSSMTLIWSNLLIHRLNQASKKAHGKSNSKQFWKLGVSGIVIAICFAVQSVVVIFTALLPRMYARNPYFYDALSKLADLCSIGAMFFMYNRVRRKQTGGLSEKGITSKTTFSRF